MGNSKLFWLNMLFPGFLSLVHTITDDFFYDPVFSHHEGPIMQHLLMLELISSNVHISYHAAQNKSWSWHQNIVTLPISYLNKSS